MYNPTNRFVFEDNYEHLPTDYLGCLDYYLLSIGNSGDFCNHHCSKSINKTVDLVVSLWHDCICTENTRQNPSFCAPSLQSFLHHWYVFIRHTCDEHARIILWTIREEMPWSDITCGQNLNWLVQVQSTRNWFSHNALIADVS